MTGEPFVLRPAQPTDAGRLGAMITEAVQARDWKPRLHTAAEDIAHAGMLVDRGWVTVAEANGEIAGFIAREGDFVHALFVANASQNAGVGTALILDAMRRTERLDLWTFERNIGAIRFYRRLGFAEVARTSGDNEEGLPDIRFRWVRSIRHPATDTDQRHQPAQVPAQLQDKDRQG